jgi:deoxyribonuclease-4
MRCIRYNEGSLPHCECALVGAFARLQRMDEVSHTSAPVYDSEDEYRPEPEPEPRPAAWCDGNIRIGIHTSIAGDPARALETASKLGCNALQIFSGSPRMWPRSGSRLNAGDAEQFRARRAALGLGPLVIHTNYLINLASPDMVTRTRSIQALNNELVRAIALGADFLVLHPGSGCGSDRGEAVRAVAQGLRRAARGIRFHGERSRRPNAAQNLFENFGDFRWGGLRILVENTSGMGSAIGARFEELRAILDLAPELPLGICLDTAHAFAAGYAIHTAEGLESTIAALDRTVTLSRVALLHVNDSKAPFDSRLDRHEHIGLGKIGRPAFQRILTHPRLSAAVAGGLPGRAFILETPIDAPGDDRRNVRLLWALAGVRAKQAPRVEDGFSMVRAKNAKKKSPQRKPPAKRALIAKSAALNIKSRARGKG